MRLPVAAVPLAPLWRLTALAVLLGAASACNPGSPEEGAEGDESESGGEDAGDPPPPWTLDTSEAFCLSSLGGIVVPSAQEVWVSGEGGLHSFLWNPASERYEAADSLFGGGFGSLHETESYAWGASASGLVRVDWESSPEVVVDMGASMAVALDDERAAFATLSAEPQLRLWTEVDGVTVVEFEGAEGARVRALGASEGQYLVRTAGPSAIWLVDPDTGSHEQQISGPDTPLVTRLVEDEGSRVWGIEDEGPLDAGGPGRLIVSDDGGATWAAVDLAEELGGDLPKDFRAAAVAVRGERMVVVDRWPTTLVISLDGGATFEVESIETGSGLTGRPTSRAAISDDGVVFVTAWCDSLLHRVQPL